MNTAKGVQQIFTREKIGKMTSQEFEENEKRIQEQLNTIGIPTNSELAYENQGKIFIWHTIGDGKVCGNCNSMEGKIFENLEDIPDDLHPNCRCYIEEIDLFAV
jgi:putative hemolysin